MKSNETSPDILGPGFYGGLSFEEYLAIPAANKSGLDLFDKSPLHYWAEYLDPEREPRPDTPSTHLGSAIHAAILEPDRYEKEYRVKPEPELFPDALVTAEDYKRACEDLGIPKTGTKDVLKKRIQEKSGGFRFFDDIEAELVRGGWKLIHARDLKTVRKISERIRSCPAAKTVLGYGRPEQTLVWRDLETGVLCKARADWITDDRTIIADIKTSKDASLSGFMRACADYNYHRQAAWYLEGFATLFGERAPLFAFPVYETSAPHASAFYYATPAMIRQGRVENRVNLARYAQCLKSGEWPGYPAELIPIDLPPWRKAKENNDAPGGWPKHELETY